MGLKAALIILFLLSLLVGYIAIQGYREYREAEGAKAEGDLSAAITHYQRSIKWYLPGVFYVAKAAEGLWQLGMEAETKGDKIMALMAYQELRSGFYAARSFYTPGTDWIERCNQKIAALMAEWEASSSQRRGHDSMEALRRKHLDILSRKERPDYFWSIVLEVGFFGWLGATIGFIVQVFQGEKGFNSRRALGWGTLFLVSYFLWILGMLKA